MDYIGGVEGERTAMRHNDSDDEINHSSEGEKEGFNLRENRSAVKDSELLEDLYKLNRSKEDPDAAHWALMNLLETVLKHAYQPEGAFFEQILNLKVMEKVLIYMKDNINDTTAFLLAPKLIHQLLFKGQGPSDCEWSYHNDLLRICLKENGIETIIRFLNHEFEILDGALFDYIAFMDCIWCAILLLLDSATDTDRIPLNQKRSLIDCGLGIMKRLFPRRKLNEVINDSNSPRLFKSLFMVVTLLTKEGEIEKKYFEEEYVVTYIYNLLIY